MTKVEDEPGVQTGVTDSGKIVYLVIDGSQIDHRRAEAALRNFFYSDPNKLGAPPSRTFPLEGGVNPDNRKP